MTEQEIEQALIEKLGDLKYTYRPDIRDRATLEANFRQHFEALNRVHLTDTEFARLLDGIVTPDVFAAAKHLRERNSFERDDGTGIISIYYPVFRVLEGSNKFFVELLARYSKIVGKHSVGTSQTVLSLNELRRIKLPIPKEAEQQKIADCLASLDNLLTAQTQKLAALKTHKKGLMQQLFPALDEVAA